MKPTRAVALGHALDVLIRSDWLLADLMADVYNDDVPEAERVSDDEVIAVLREMKEEAASPDIADAVEAERNRVLDIRRALVAEGDCDCNECIAEALENGLPS